VRPCVRVGAVSRAVGHVIGEVNNVEFGVAEIHVNISRPDPDDIAGTQVTATVHQIPDELGQSHLDTYHWLISGF